METVVNLEDMQVNPEGARNIMEYVRELEARLIQCRHAQAARVKPFQAWSFIFGFALGAVLTAFAFLAIVVRR